MALKLALNLLIFASLILLETKSILTAHEPGSGGRDGDANRAVQGSLDRASNLVKKQLLAEYENSVEKFVLNELYGQLKAQSDSKFRLIKNAEKTMQEFWAALEVERRKLASGQPSELVRKICTELGVTVEADEAGGDQEQLDPNLLAEMIEQLKEHLVGSSSSAASKETTAGEKKVDSSCGPSGLAMYLSSWLEVFSYRTDGELFKSLQARAINVFESCKPTWDREYMALVEAGLEEVQQVRMRELFDNIISFSGLFKTGVRPTDSSPGFDFMTLTLFNRFRQQTPPPASVLLFLFRHFEAQFNLDEDMKNGQLDEKTYKKAVCELLEPLCKDICKKLREPSQFFLDLLYDNKLLDDKAVYTRLFLDGVNYGDGDGSKKVNMWIASTSICCRLTDPKVSRPLHAKIFKVISRSDQAGASGLDQSKTGSDSEGEAVVEGDDYIEEFDKMNEQFSKNRRELFLRENGFKGNAFSLKSLFDCLQPT